ncbi:hypothetical protein BASA50_000698 [Batrachochytrium salamandrivorans]|uniref:CCR4-NOT transcription complex subunit 11 n=1 Tax=Batrachochytrium salamandrivorans TaxID=1357716 RepID=A0ABQ8ETC8_9FUNG|nr:hypothetical protein BASA50_000698 [Batrachochytrium salamandrivorans]
MDLLNMVYDDQMYGLSLMTSASKLSTDTHAVRAHHRLYSDPVESDSSQRKLEQRVLVLYTLAQHSPVPPVLCVQGDSSAQRLSIRNHPVAILLMSCMCRMGAFKQATLHERVYAMRLFDTGVEGFKSVRAIDAVNIAVPVSLGDIDRISQIVLTYRHICDGFPDPIRIISQDDIPIENWTRSDAKKMACSIVRGTFPHGIDLVEYMQPASQPPPILPCTIMEKIPWTHPPLSMHDCRFNDSESSVDFSERDHARQLIIYAYTSPLSTTQQRIVSQWIKRLPQIVHMVEVTVNAFAGLVENNPSVAAEFIGGLSKSLKFPSYLDVLIDASTLMHSMEVVNWLAMRSNVVIPQEFLHRYLAKCMVACDPIRDKYMQARQVRLICGFVVSLVQGKVISIMDYQVDLQTFCLEYSHVKEAAELYRLVLQGTGA